jgi:hypothetical protein
VIHPKTITSLLALFNEYYKGNVDNHPTDYSIKFSIQYADDPLVNKHIRCICYLRGGGDESETNTEQEIKQKNVGSGESTNNNCALNSIDTTTAATVACPVTAVN